MRAKERIIFALDVPDATTALGLVKKLGPHVGGFKVGMELFTAAGPGLVEKIMSRGANVFLDLKFHDIPNTVAGALRSAAGLGVWLTNVHALGGYEMMRHAAEAVSGRDTKVIAVTVLTSSDEATLNRVGIPHTPGQLVQTLATLAKEAGVDGVVASPLEAKKIRELWPDGMIVTPGVRPAGADMGDQKRVATPAGAIGNGADYIVVGRPIREADDCVKAANDIALEISGALAN